MHRVQEYVMPDCLELKVVNDRGEVKSMNHFPLGSHPAVDPLHDFSSGWIIHDDTI